MSLSIANIAYLDLPPHVRGLVQEASRSTHRDLSEAERRLIADYLRDLQEAERELLQTSRDAEALDKALDVDIAPGLWSRAEHALQEKMDLCHGILSSIRRIPPEVIALIFELYIAEGISAEDDMDVEYISEQAYGSLSAPSSPFTLCQVCRAWKNIAMHHPAVWSSPTIRVQMGVPYHAPEPDAHGPRRGIYQVTETHAQAIRKWMERIGENPWSLRLIMRGWLRATMRHSTPRLKHPSDPRGSPLYHLLPPVAVDNLRDLHIVYRDNMYMATGLGGSTLVLPKVKSLVVDMEASRSEASLPGYWDQGEEPVADLPAMPCLEEAVLHGLNFSTISECLPWQQLTRLCLGGEKGRFNDIVKVLGSCTNLVEACFVYAAFHANEEQLTPSQPLETQATCLRKLTFVGVPFNIPFLGLSFPALSTLTTVFKELRPWHPTNLSNFYAITDLYLESLAIDTTRLSTHIAIFAAFTSITRLTLNVSLPYGDLFRVLTFSPTVSSTSPGPGPYLPRLEELGVHIELEPYPCYKCSGFGNIQGMAPPEPSLALMLESRTLSVDEAKSQCTRLKLFTIRVCPRSGRDNAKDRNDAVADRIRSAMLPFEGHLEIRQTRGQSDYIYERNLSHWSDGFAESLEKIRTL